MQRKVVFETPWFSVEEAQVRMASASDAQPLFYKINQPSGVVALPVTPDGDFVLIRQYRPTLNRMTIEFPAGGVDAKEAPEIAMRRELAEETGCDSNNIKQVGTGVLRIDREDTLNTFYVAFDMEPIVGRSPEEGVEVFCVSPHEFVDLIRENKFDHVAALPIFPMAEISLGQRLLPMSITT